jgi:hypothetical protein
MRRLIMALALALATVATGSPALAQAIPLSALVTERARFDQQPVIVTGTVGIGGVPGGATQRFSLVSGGFSVDVVAPGGFPVRPGAQVEVEGIFRASSNLIEAFRVTPR